MFRNLVVTNSKRWSKGKKKAKKRGKPKGVWGSRRGVNDGTRSSPLGYHLAPVVGGVFPQERDKQDNSFSEGGIKWGDRRSGALTAKRERRGGDFIGVGLEGETRAGK